MIRWSGLVAGIALLVLAFVDLWFATYTFVSPAAIVGGVVPGTPAEKMNLKPGDAIAAVNGTEVDNFDELIEAALDTPPGNPIYLTTYRDGMDMGRVTLVRPPPTPGADDPGGYWIGIDPPHRAVIGALAPGNPAEKAGLVRGDEITAVNGQEIQFFSELSRATATAEGAVELKGLRGGKEFTVSVTPLEVALKGPDDKPFLDAQGNPIKQKIIGVALDPTRFLYAPVTRSSSLISAIADTLTAPVRIVRTIQEFTGSRPLDPTRDRTGLVVQGAGIVLATVGWLTFLAGVAMVFVLKPAEET